jgi:outer membrane protein assembly factor BamB
MLAFKKYSQSFLAALISLSLVGPLMAQTETEESRRFRGTLGDGKSQQVGLPTTWSASDNIVWKLELPGPGASSPVTYQDRIYLTCYSGYGMETENPGDMEQLQRHLLCISRGTGAVIWDSVQKSTNPQQVYQQFIRLHGYASGTPAVDESGIYVFYGTTGAAAYNHDGTQRWLVNCGTKHHVFGTSNSPVIYQDLIIINASVESGDLIALDKVSGAEVWRTGGMNQSWNTPVLVTTAEGVVELAVNTKGKIYGIDPDNGEILWSCEGIDDYICPSIIAEGEMLYAVGGRQNTALAIRSGGRGDVTESHLLWKIREGSNVCSPCFIDGKLYWTSEQKGIAHCVDASTGKSIYKQRLQPAPNLLYASPLAADGKIYYISREMGTYVVAIDDSFQLLAHNTIGDDDSVFNGSPVASEGCLLIRSNKFLYCIGDKSSEN